MLTSLQLTDGEIVDDAAPPFPPSQWLVHEFCGKTTKVSDGDVDQMKRAPEFFDKFFCLHCKLHRPAKEFVWYNTNIKLGT